MDTPPLLLLYETSGRSSCHHHDINTVVERRTVLEVGIPLSEDGQFKTRLYDVAAVASPAGMVRSAEVVATGGYCCGGD